MLMWHLVIKIPPAPFMKKQFTAEAGHRLVMERALRVPTQERYMKNS